MPTQKQGTNLTTRVYFHTYTKALATRFGICPISPSYWNAMSSLTTTQAPFSIRNMLSASKSPLAFSVHFVNNQTVLFIFFQGVNTILSLAWSLNAIMLPADSSWKPSAKAPWQVCIVHIDAGSTDHFAQQNLQIPKHASNMTLPIWLLMLVYLL